MQHTNRTLIIAGGVLVAAMAGSGLVAAPAFAADDIHGTVLDAGAPVGDVNVTVLRYVSAEGEWDTYADTNTASDGSWSIPTPADSGKYALWYDATDSSQALYSRAQSTTGLTAPDGSSSAGSNRVENLPFATDFTVTSGAPSATSFSVSLAHNAGAASFALVDGAGTAITGAQTNNASVYAYSGYNATTGYTNGQISAYSNDPAFTGTLAEGHLAPATYYYAYAQANGYNTEVLEPITVTAGSTTQGTAVLQANGAPYVSDSETSPHAITVSGVAKVGTVLTANVPTSTNGTPFTVTYQWYTNGAPLLGATAQTFVPSGANIGDQLYVTANLRQAGHTSDQVYTHDAVGPVVVGDPNQAVVTVTGSAKFGSTLKATVTGGSVGGAVNAGYQWYRNGAPITGADGSSYTLAKADVGQKVFASVTSFAQGHTDAVIPSNTVSVAHDKATLAYSAKKSISKSTKLKVKVNLKDGTTKNAASGTVRVYYSATKYKKLSFTTKSTTKTATLPKLSKGKHTIKIKYYGDTHYLTKSISFKVTVK